MILPIGHGESSTRRLPWVTFAIMAICLLALLASNPAEHEPAWDREQPMADAEQYWRDHAYLEAEPELRTRVAYDVMPAQRKQYLALLFDQALATAPRDVERWEAEQAELDRLADLAFGRTLPPEALTEGGPYRDWGLIPSRITLLTLLTHMFMHAGWLHLLGNLFMLFLAGPAVEDRLGRPLFAAFYLGAGIFAALFWALLTPDQNVPLVGASGAIAGVLGAFLIRFWTSDIRFAYFFLIILRPVYGTFEAKAWVMLPLWLGNEVLQGWLAHSLGLSSGVAYWAHVGGFLFGTGAVFAIRLLGVEEKFIDKAIEAKITLIEANPALEQAFAARAAGDDEVALASLGEAFRTSPKDRDVALALWDAARAVGRPAEGATAMAAVFRQCVSDGDTALAIQHWLDLTASVPAALVDPGSMIRLLPTLLEREGDRELAIRALRQCVDPHNRGLSPGLALRVVELARDLDPPAALRAARRVLDSADLHEAKRAKIEQLARELDAAGVSEPPVVVPPPPPRPSTRHAAAPPPLPPAAPPPLPPAAAPAASASAEPIAAELAVAALDGIADGPRFSGIKLVEAAPSALRDDGLRLRIAGDRKAKVGYEQIEAIAVAAVRGLGPKPVLLIDLLLNWSSLEETPLRVIRLQSSAFDPRALMPDAADAMSALKQLVALLLERSGAVALPDAAGARGEPYASFDELRCYELEVLQVASG